MTGVIPCCIKHSIIADEQGAQQVWSNTLVAPPGTSIWNFFFFIYFFICHPERSEGSRKHKVGAIEILHYTSFRSE